MNSSAQPRDNHLHLKAAPIFAGVAVLLSTFAGLAHEVTEDEPLGFDRAIITALRSPPDYAVPVGPHWFNTAMVDLTALGGVTVLTLAVILSTALLLLHRRWRMAGLLVCATVSGALAGTALKHLFARPRPDVVNHLVEVNSLSFPSGHAMNSAIVFLTLGAIVSRNYRERSTRMFILICAVGMTLIIGFSRIYLGVHWPSDVLAGWSIGGAWALLMGLVASRMQEWHRIEQPSSD
ncbi:phosphatase PAP2 family protein [Erythrobacter sp. SG61-1L]|uniref:phosphatase PAP2 family protein n=1 Tax=Erythrobacter sp. SG61-1L TaxID=1603897 RepID=UPI000A5F7A28|nr:phosphatase PAP2 family protein [Erythrobacter sp. SG61-1L]